MLPYVVIDVTPQAYLSTAQHSRAGARAASCCNMLLAMGLCVVINLTSTGTSWQLQGTYRKDPLLEDGCLWGVVAQSRGKVWSLGCVS